MKNFIAGKNNVQATITVAAAFGGLSDAMVAPIEVAGEFLTNKGLFTVDQACNENMVFGVTGKKTAEVNWAVDALNYVVEQMRHTKQGEVMDMVVIGKGVGGISKEQIINAMQEKGLVIHGRADTKLGEGMVTGFEASSTGLFVSVLIDEQAEARKFMSSAVHPVLTEAQMIREQSMRLAPAAASAPETDINQMISDVKVSIESFVDENAQPGVEQEPTFDQKADDRDASTKIWLAEQKAKAATVAGSSAAEKILAMASGLINNKPAATPASAPAANAAPTIVTPKQTNGGNTMSTNTQTQVKDAPAQSVAGGTQARTNTGAGTQPRTGAGNANANRGANAPGRGAGAGTLRMNAGAAQATATGRKKLALKKDAVVSRFSREGQWYMDAKYTRVLSPELFEAERANVELGITGAKMYDAQDYAQMFNKDARDNEIAVMEIFFGAISFEFKINASFSEDARSPWYCGNVSFVTNKRGTGGEWRYTVARRSDAVNVVVLTDGSVREATAQEVEAKQSVTVGGTAWKNKETVFGIKMDEEVMAQVLRWAHYGWEQMYPTEVAAQ